MKALYTTTIAATFCALAGMSLQASAGSVTEVTAETYGEAQTAVVSYADLDLSSPEGQEALHYRISRAAEQVCGSTDIRVAGGVAQASRNEDCYRESLSKALSEVSKSAVASVN